MKILYFRAKCRISKQAPPNEELNMQQGKHTPNSQNIFHFLSLHMCDLVHKLLIEFTTLNYLMCLTTLRPHCIYILENF